MGIFHFWLFYDVQEIYWHSYKRWLTFRLQQCNSLELAINNWLFTQICSEDKSCKSISLIEEGKMVVRRIIDAETYSVINGKQFLIIHVNGGHTWRKLFKNYSERVFHQSHYCFIADILLCVSWFPSNYLKLVSAFVVLLLH